MTGRRRVRSSQQQKCSPDAVARLLTYFGYPVTPRVVAEGEGTCYYGLTGKRAIEAEAQVIPAGWEDA